jgi:glutamine amidotransferase-like protein/asparagine synthase
MCGICGLASLDGSPVDAGPLEAMNDTLRDRGPDAEGTVVDGPVALASRRLSIIDLAGGDQPIANENGSIQVVQNGEIYNHRDLRAVLGRQGHRFRTLSEETLRRQGFFRPEIVVRLLDDHVAGREHLSRQLWGLLTFTLWHEQVAAKPAAVAA